MINFYFSDKDYEDNYFLLYEFDEYYKDKWFEDSFVIDMIKDIDKSNPVVPGIFNSEWLGNFTAKELSGGAKGLLIYLYKDEMKE